MTTKPYTRADVELVERAIHDVTPPIRDGYVDGRDLLNAEACAVLDALAAAGRLLPAGTETEYGYRCDEDCTQPHRASEESARTKVRAMRTGSVVRRLAGPWTEEPRLMSHTPRTPRAVAQRQAIGRRLRAYRIAVGITNRDLAVHTGTSKGQVYAAESATTDIVTGTLIDLAAAVGLEVALVADYHLPLLNLTADQVEALRNAALFFYAGEGAMDGPTYSALHDALVKLTTSEETDR